MKAGVLAICVTVSAVAFGGVSAGNDLSVNDICGAWKIDVDRAVELMTSFYKSRTNSDSYYNSAACKAGIAEIADTIYLQITTTNLSMYMTADTPFDTVASFVCVSNESSKDIVFIQDGSEVKNPWKFHLSLTSSNTLKFTKSNIPSPILPVIWSKQSGTKGESAKRKTGKSLKNGPKPPGASESRTVGVGADN